MLICIFGTMMDNRMLGLLSAEAKIKRGNPKGDMPFGTRLCMAKCSVLYPLSVRLRKSVFVNRVLKQQQTKRAWFLCRCQSQKLSSFIRRERVYKKRYLHILNIPYIVFLTYQNHLSFWRVELKLHYAFCGCTQSRHFCGCGSSVCSLHGFQLEVSNGSLHPSLC